MYIQRLDNFKVILNQFFYGGKQFVEDSVISTIRNEVHNRDNILYNPNNSDIKMYSKESPTDEIQK